MASAPHLSGVDAARGGRGPMRRFAASILDRRRASAGLAERLRDVLPRPPQPGDSAALRCDPLTGLGLQSDFVVALQNIAARPGRSGTSHSLVLIDVDHLGVVNTRNGHLNGDALLRQTAEAMRRHATSQQGLFRIGGDEFAMLLPAAGAEEAYGRAMAVLGSMLHPTDASRPGSISAGVAGIPWSTLDADVMFRQATAALADVKRRGRASVALFDARFHVLPRPASAEHGDLVERIVADRTLRPVFQPIIDLSNGRVLGYEGLVRLPASDGSVGARELFAAADASDRVAQLDIACLETVIDGARAIRPDHLLTLNLSPRTLAGREFDPAWLLQSLLRAGISPSRVVVELSDDKRVDDLGRLHGSFVELQRLGLRLAADDVSADDPAKRLLTHLPFDIVKIDLAQVWEGAQTGPFLALLRDTALGRRARVVAEGVETSEQLVAVRDLEFGAGQGFLLGRPDASVSTTHVDVFELETGAYEPTVAEAVVPPPAAEPDSADELEVIPEERRRMFMPPAGHHLEREPGAA